VVGRGDHGNSSFSHEIPVIPCVVSNPGLIFTQTDKNTSLMFSVGRPSEPYSTSHDSVDLSHRVTLSVQRKQELELEEKHLSHFFSASKFLNFDAVQDDADDEEDYDQQTSWFFYFIDIIFVATVFNISRLFTKCGEDKSVYVLAASYFVIVFSTRMFFDTFTSILHARGVLHKIIFILYGIGIYCMTLNIASVNDEASLEELCVEAATGLDRRLQETGSDLVNFYVLGLKDSMKSKFYSDTNSSSVYNHKYGNCHQTDNFTYGFAISFLFTRLLIFVLFFLYCTVFHDPAITSKFGSDHVKVADTSGKKSKTRVLSKESALSEFELSVTSSSDETPVSKGKRNEPFRSLPNGALNKGQSAADHRAHIKKVFLWKIVPLALSSAVMMFSLGGYATTTIFPAVALIELVGDFVPEFLIDRKGLVPNRHNLEERLGLMFMLVLGETMLGFLVQRGNSALDLSTYSTLL
jgi:hypothetical protein